MRDRIGPSAVDDAVLFAGLLSIYVATLHPSVPGGDSGELIAAAWTGGVAHPPGYPSFTMLAGGFARVLAAGEVAWRVNLLTAICAALAAVVLRRSIASWGGSRAAGFLGAGLFALSPLVWTWATAAEVFSLNAVFAAALLLVARNASRSSDVRWAYAGAALLGLGLTNHHTLVLLGAPLAAWVAFRRRVELLRARRLAILAGAFLAGLLPYLWLPIAGARDPEILWGDPTTPAGFARHLLRSEYGTLRLGGDVPAGRYFLEQVALYLGSLPRQTLWVGGLLGVVGCVAAARREAFGRVVLACWLLYVVVFFFAANLPIDDPLFREVTTRFWQQPNVIVFLWIGLGFAWLARRVPDRARAVAVPAATVLLLAAQFALNFDRQNRRSDRHVERYARAILEPLPRGAVLLTSGDLVTNSVRYLRSCGAVRRDVIVIDQELATRAWYVRHLRRRHPEIRFPGEVYDPASAEGFSMRRWLEANGARDVWVYPEPRGGDPSLAGSYEAWPIGLPQRLLAARARTEAELETWRETSRRAVARLGEHPWPSAERFPPGTWERVVLDDLWQAHNRRAVRLLEVGIARGDAPDWIDEARSVLERVASDDPAPSHHVFKNLGIAYDRARARDPSLLGPRNEAWSAYLRLAPGDDPGREAIAAALAR